MKDITIEHRRSTKYTFHESTHVMNMNILQTMSGFVLSDIFPVIYIQLRNLRMPTFNETNRA